MSEVLITYFSQCRVARNIAENTVRENPQDIFEIKQETYMYQNLDWQDKNSKTTKKIHDKTFKPPIKISEDVSKHETTVMEFPLWGCTLPTIINTFTKSLVLSEIIKIFCTSSGVEKQVNDLKLACFELKIKKSAHFISFILKAKELMNMVGL